MRPNPTILLYLSRSRGTRKVAPAPLAWAFCRAWGGITDFKKNPDRSYRHAAAQPFEPTPHSPTAANSQLIAGNSYERQRGGSFCTGARVRRAIQGPYATIGFLYVQVPLTLQSYSQGH